MISVAAELAGVHPQTLRIYERKGLLDPARTGGAIAATPTTDIAQLRRIQELTAGGLNLEGVRRILALESRGARSCADELDERRSEAAPRPWTQTHRQYRRDLVPLVSQPRAARPER